MGFSPAALKSRIRKLDPLKKLSGARLRGRIFLVGGALREAALGQKPNDYDFAIERPEDLNLFERIFNSPSFLLGKKPIQTHRLISLDAAIDITILEGTLEQDLLRRDFTINAIAYDLRDDKLFDPLGGLEDISRRIIRYPREESISEDPLRMVKAIRHFATLPGFTMDGNIIAAIRAHRELIHQVAPERIKYEMDLIMSAKDVAKAIRTMEETGLLFDIFPELLTLRELDREKGMELEALGHTLGGFNYISRIKRLYAFSIRETKCSGYALLFHDLGKPLTFSYDEEKRRVHFFYHERHSRTIAEAIMERLRFSTAESRLILSLIENHMRIFLISRKEATEKAVRRLVYKMEHLTPSLVFLTLLDLYGSSEGRENASTRRVRSRCREILAAYEEWKKEPLSKIVTGTDLIALGFTEGPLIGRVLQEIREKQIAGEIREKQEALRYAREARVRLSPPL